MTADKRRFIVLVSNAIQCADAADLPDLGAFVASLESCRAVSGGAEKLFSMCRLFLDVAELYVRAKHQTPTEVGAEGGMGMEAEGGTGMGMGIEAEMGMPDSTPLTAPTSTPFATHLNALGLVSNAWPPYDDVSAASLDTGAHLDAPAVFGAQVFGAQNSVHDWFSGSRHLISYLDGGSDLHMPDIENAFF